MTEIIKLAAACYAAARDIRRLSRKAHALRVTAPFPQSGDTVVLMTRNRYAGLLHQIGNRIQDAARRDFEAYKAAMASDDCVYLRNNELSLKA